MLDQEQYERYFSLWPKEISTEFKEAIRKGANYIEFKKGETLLDENSKNNIYYILKGSCIRFIITPTGEEKAIMFHTESFIPIIGNIYVRNKNSNVTYLIRANENTEVIEMEITSLRKLALQDKAYVQFVTERILHFYAIMNQIQNHVIGLSKEDFFLWLMKEYSFIFQRFLSKDIANFMGVTPVWFSTIKAKLFKK